MPFMFLAMYSTRWNAVQTKECKLRGHRPVAGERGSRIGDDGFAVGDRVSGLARSFFGNECGARQLLK